MASTLIDIAIMTPSSAFGTSATIPLGTAATINGVTYLSFANAGAVGGQQVSYSILDTGNSEIGTATYTSSNATLTGRTPTKSTNGNAAISATSAALVLATVRGEDLNSYIVTGQIPGSTTNNNANVGNVGEFINVTTTRAAAIALASSVVSVTATLSLTAGDWDVFGTAGYTGTSSNANILGGYGLSSTTLPGVDSGQEYILPTVNIAALDGLFPLPQQRFSFSTTTNIYLLGFAQFGVGTVTSYGAISARRRR